MSLADVVPGDVKNPNTLEAHGRDLSLALPKLARLQDNDRNTPPMLCLTHYVRLSKGPL